MYYNYSLLFDLCCSVGDRVYFTDTQSNTYARFNFHPKDHIYNCGCVYINYYTLGSSGHTYELFQLNKNKYSAGLDEKFKKITRIEKYFDNEYRLIWTIEDGEIMTDNINFIKLNGIYYSAKTLEHLLQEVIFIKDAVLKLYI